MDVLSSGIEEESRLRNAGFGDDEVGQWKADTTKSLYDGGFSESEVKNYFGQKEPDMTPMKEYIKTNLSGPAPGPAPKPTGEAPTAPPPAPPNQVDSLIQAVEHGFQFSVSGLDYRKRNPDLILPEHAPTFYRIASQAAQFAGDLPAMIPGMVMGGAAGAASQAALAVIPPVGIPAIGLGAAIGAGAGAFALPTAMRKILMDHYEKGDIQDFGDFWERASGTFLETMKSGIVGAATGGIGAVSRAALASVSSSAAIVSAGSAAAEVGTMTTLGKAMEGQIPSLQDFTDAAIFIGGLHAAAKTTAKLRGVYSEFGISPQDVAQMAEKDTVLKQQLLTEGKNLPDAFGGGNIKPEGPSPFELPAPTVKVPKGEAPAEPTAQDKILSHIGKASEKENPNFFPKFYADVVDANFPVKQLEKGKIEVSGQKIEASDSPSLLLQQFVDHPAIALQTMTEGQVDFKTKDYTGKPGLEQILSKTKGEILAFEADLIARRIQDLGKENNLGFDRAAIDQVRKENGSKFDEPAKDFVEWQNSGLKYYADSGGLSKKDYEALVTSGPSYVSMKVISEEGKAIKGTKKKPIRKMSEEGSIAKKQDPIVAATDNMALFVRLAEKNRAVDAAVRVFGEDPEIMKKVESYTLKAELSDSEAIKLLKANGIEDPDPSDIKTIKIFRKLKPQEGPNDVTQMVDGKSILWRFEDPDVARAFKSMDGNFGAQNFFMKAFVAAKTVLRAGVTTTLEFVGRNSFRDNLFATITSEDGQKPYIGILDAMGDLYSKKGAYKNWMLSGGANGAFVEIGENWILKNYPELNRDPQSFLKKTWNRVETAKEYMEMISNIVENGPRYRAYKLSLGDKTDLNSRLKAGLASREATVDFQRKGGSQFIQNWTATTAFMNPAIQGVDRSIRAIKDNPKKAVSLGFATITAPLLSLYLSQKDDPRWDELPNWEKYTHFILLTDNWQSESYPGQAKELAPYLVRKGKNGGLEINHGIPFKLPLPQEMGILFGALPLLIMEAFHKDHPGAAKDFIQTSAGLLSPNFVPTLAAPVIEQLMNKNFFTGNELVGDHLKKELPQYRYAHYTSETAKAIGGLIGSVPYLRDYQPKDTPVSSPAVIDNYIQGWTGTLGKYVVQLSDLGLRKAGLTAVKNPPSATMKDWPIVRGFTSRWPSANTQSIVQFRESYKGVDEFWTSYNRLLKEDPTEAQHLLASQDNSSFLYRAKEIHDALNEKMKALNQIERHADYSGDEKRQLMDTILFQMTEVAKQGNLNFKEAFEEGKKK